MSFRKLFALVCVSVFLCSPVQLVPREAAAQSQPADTTQIRFVILDDYVRDFLASDWDLHAKDPIILERGYCLGWQLDFWAGEMTYRVTQISRPDSVDAKPSSISFSCTGRYPGHLAQLHVHPPQTCATRKGPCWNGGPYAYQCQPSDQDQAWLTWLQAKGWSRSR
jgi:hypothetical protein